MTKEEFNKLMDESNLTKRKLSEILGTTYQGVNNWGTNGRDYPYWVKPFLQTYAENIKCKEIQQILKDSGLCDKIKTL